MSDVTIKKTSDILTKEELKKEKVKRSSPSNKKSEKPKKGVVQPKKEVKNLLKEKQDVEVKFECGFAPGGESNIAFLHKWEGQEYKYELKLNNKIYILPKDLLDSERQRYRAALRANGFMDVTVIEAGASFDKKKGEYIYSLIHPEHTPRNRINCTISLVLHDDSGRPMFDKNGKQVTEQVTIIEGKTQTDNPLVYEALLSNGFLSGKKIEK